MKLARTHYVLIFLLATFVIWQLWNPAMKALFGGRHLLRERVEGEWVGELNISKGYDPKMKGKTVELHRKAAIYFRLEKVDPYLMRFGGPGELYIIGEDKPRTIRVGDLGWNKQGRVSAVIVSDPMLTNNVHGTYDLAKPEQMTLYSESGMEFTAVLHQGTTKDYEVLVSRLQTE